MRGELLRLIPLWLGLSAARSALALLIRQPQIWTDELTYWQIARSFHRWGTIVFHEKTYDTPAVLLSVLVSPLFSLADPELVYTLARVVGSFAMCAVVFPAYGLAREQLDPEASWRVAVLAALVPGCVYTATLMPETLFYPLSTLAAWLSVRLLAAGRARDAALASAAYLLAFFAKPHVLFFAAAYGGAVGLWLLGELLEGRRAGLVRELAVRLAPTAALALLLPIRLLVRADTVRPSLVGILLGTYAQVGHPPPASAARVALVALALALTVAFATGLLGLASALTSAGTRSARGLTATLALLVVGISVVVVARSTLRLDGDPRLHERYLFVAAPLLLTAAAAASATAGTARRLALTAGLGAAFVVMLRTFPKALDYNASSDAPSLTAFFTLKLFSGTGAAFAGALLAMAGLLGAAALAARRPRLAFAATASLFVLLNAGWYTYLVRVGRDERGKRFALALGRSLPVGARVAVVTDRLDLHVVWALETWLPGPLTLYSVGAQAGEWWIGDSGDVSRLTALHHPTHVVHARDLPGAEGWGPEWRAEADLPTPAVVRQNPTSEVTR